MPSISVLPQLRSHVTVAHHHRKTAFLEVYELPPDRKLREWFLFEGEGEPCVVIFALTAKSGQHGQHVVTLRHFRYGARDVIHELPGGGVEKQRGVGKDQWYKDAVKNELKQETGCEVQDADIQSLAEPLWFDPASVRAQFQPMLALNVVARNGREEEDEEFLERQLVPVHEWFQQIVSGKVTDAKSIAVSLLAIHKLPSEVQKMAVAGLMTRS